MDGIKITTTTTTTTTTTIVDGKTVIKETESIEIVKEPVDDPTSETNDPPEEDGRRML